MPGFLFHCSPWNYHVKEMQKASEFKGNFHFYSYKIMFVGGSGELEAGHAPLPG